MIGEILYLLDKQLGIDWSLWKPDPVTIPTNLLQFLKKPSQNGESDEEETENLVDFFSKVGVISCIHQKLVEVGATS